MLLLQVARRVSRLIQLRIWAVFLCLIIKEAVGQCMDGDLRLVNGGTPLEGRLEVCLSNQWGTICDDFWKKTSLNAQVACRQLGFSSQGAQTRASDPNTYRPPPFGQGTGLIFWDDIQCTGSELRLEDCPHLTTLQGSVDCIHDEDVGVTCQPLPTTTSPTTTGVITNSPTHQITGIDIFIDVNIDTTGINVDTNISVDIPSTSSQTNRDKTTTSSDKVTTASTSLVEPQLEVNNAHNQIEYAKVIIIPLVVSITLIVSVAMLILIVILITKRTATKYDTTINVERDIRGDHIQAQGDIESVQSHTFIEGQSDTRVEAGDGQLGSNLCYEQRKAIESQVNPAYDLPVFPGVILQQEINLETVTHHYETIAEVTKGAPVVVYHNVCTLLHHHQHSTAKIRPSDYINLH